MACSSPEVEAPSSLRFRAHREVSAAGGLLHDVDIFENRIHYSKWLGKCQKFYLEPHLCKN